ncbi:MAG TPA: hypothetical protein VIZ28_16175 [Chitinophagaceae bacterium]
MTGEKVLNAGMSSYGTARELKNLYRLDTSGLQTLIIQYGRNDEVENEQFVRDNYSLQHPGKIPTGHTFRRITGVNNGSPASILSPSPGSLFAKNYPRLSKLKKQTMLTPLPSLSTGQLSSLPISSFTLPLILINAKYM